MARPRFIIHWSKGFKRSIHDLLFVIKISIAHQFTWYSNYTFSQKNLHRWSLRSICNAISEAIVWLFECELFCKLFLVLSIQNIVRFDCEMIQPISNISWYFSIPSVTDTKSRFMYVLIGQEISGWTAVLLATVFVSYNVSVMILTAAVLKDVELTFEIFDEVLIQFEAKKKNFEKYFREIINIHFNAIR